MSLSLLKKALKTYPNECVNCGATENLEADHIIPKVLWDDKAKADRIHNIRLLCKACHQLVTTEFRRARMARVTLDGNYIPPNFPEQKRKPKLAGSRSKYSGRQGGW